ncbi:MAG: hypothetical protein RIR01_677 [Bacteroidota bacterium]|jgi:uncharacterized membrane protein
MNNLNLTKVRIDVLNVALKIKIALDEIKEKQPNRREYIDPMTESVKQLHNAYEAIKTLQEDLHLAKKRNYDLERLNLELGVEVRELKNNLELTNKMNEL